MATKERMESDGELSELELEGIAGGQEFRKMGTMVVEGKRLKPERKSVVKIETVVATAQRDKLDLAGTRLAQSDPTAKKH